MKEISELLILFILWIIFRKIVDNLQNDNPLTQYDKFKFLQQEFEICMNLVCQKRFYPYEWMDDTEKLNQESLPTIESFCSQLSQKSISEPDYSHATNVYNKLISKTFTDYN